MTTKNLEGKVQQAGGPIKMFRGLPATTYAFPYRVDYTSWQDEQYAWRHTATMFDQSDHMSEYYFEGPDALRLCSEVGVNTLKNFGPGRAKHLVCVNDDGLYLGDCILSYYGTNQLGMCGVATNANWASYIAEIRGYDVKVHQDPPTLWNKTGRRFFHYQLNGPVSQKILEKAHGGSIEPIKFFHMGRVTVAGCDLYVINHTMSGKPNDDMTGFEIYGAVQHKKQVFDALCAAGQEFGMRLGGARSYVSAALEGGWIPALVPALFGPKMKGFREWLPAHTPEGNMPLLGSFDSPSIEDYYFTPWALNYGKIINFDHDFIGREALERRSKESQRRKVWLHWDKKDAMRLIEQSLFGGAQRAKTVDFPSATPIAMMYDNVTKAGRHVGIGTTGGYTVNLGEIVTLGIVDPDIRDGEVVTLEWGEPAGTLPRFGIEPHVQSSVKVRIASQPPLKALSS